MIFVSMPVTDLERANAFYTALGWERNPAFSDHNGTCIVVEPDHVYFMLVTREFYATFTKKPIADPAKEVAFSVVVACDSREEVDSQIAAGIAAGGAEPMDPQDLGFMYSRDLEDPDGNTLGFMWMDPTAAEQGPPEHGA